jgi:uncharacterized protein
MQGQTLEPCREQRKGGMQSLAFRSLRMYKRWISPAFPPSCRFTPTCSEYAMEAVERHGVLRGAMMSAWRLLRCHPLAKGGLDPVPRSGRIGSNISCRDATCRVSQGEANPTATN